MVVSELVLLCTVCVSAFREGDEALAEDAIDEASQLLHRIEDNVEGLRACQLVEAITAACVRLQTERKKGRPPEKAADPMVTLGAIR